MVFHFDIFLYCMLGMAAVVFVALFFVQAGYGIFTNKQWGAAINNKLAWVLMEVPVFLLMFGFLFYKVFVEKNGINEIGITRIVIFAIFQTHYLQRAFIFPFLMKGKSKMPLSVMFMGVFFNIANATMQGYWLFFESYNYADRYLIGWLSSPWFIVGTALFLFGFVVNLRSDYIIRHLRKSPEDTKHYLPKGGMFKYVTSANYFGEIIEWLGFAILTCSLSGFVFFVWTFANLVPRAYHIHKKYREEFAGEIKDKNLKAVIPFVF